MSLISTCKVQLQLIPEAFSAPPPSLFLSLFRPLLLAFHMFSPILSSLESFMHFCLIFFHAAPLSLVFLNGKNKQKKKQKREVLMFQAARFSPETQNT